MTYKTDVQGVGVLSYELALHGGGILSYKTALQEGGILSNETALQEGSIPVAVSDIIFYLKNFVVMEGARIV
jgi:hypothetical protein